MTGPRGVWRSRCGSTGWLLRSTASITRVGLLFGRLSFAAPNGLGLDDAGANAAEADTASIQNDHDIADKGLDAISLPREFAASVFPG